MTAPARPRWFALGFPGVLAAAVCGCGAKTGTVAGKVTVDGKPAVGATVIFGGENNMTAAAIVYDDGTFETPGVPVGPVTIALMPDMGVRVKPPSAGEDSGPGGGAGPSGFPVFGKKPTPSPAIPKRYQTASTSGLTLTVTGGRNEFNIEMTSK
jgi:hypothetical protein